MDDQTDYLKRLDVIDQQLAEGSYKPGPWQSLISELDNQPRLTRRSVAQKATDVSTRLHGRNGFVTAPFIAGLIIELVIFAVGIWQIQADSLWWRLFGVVCLGLTAQPLIKITAGLLLGVRYSYVYLWYFEPRFKMAFGSYLTLDRSARCLFHLAGSVGTPLALLIGAQILHDHFWLWLACMAGFFGATLMQLGAFVAYFLGVRKIGPFALANLTTPAMLARELSAVFSR
jgi:hypothetical protein